MEFEAGFGGSPPVWSSDGKQLVISPGVSRAPGDVWLFTTFRMNADGTRRETLKVPPEDGVHDWSADGKWLLTASSRNAKIGWQLYVIRPDGTDIRQITEGGNPYYARFSPDGRRVLYSDGTTEERRGIWVVDRDGKDGRRLFPTGRGVASACWSPDGSRLAIAIRELGNLLAGPDPCRVEIMDLDGTHRSSVPLPARSVADMPDWR
jgi:TolB protein